MESILIVDDDVNLCTALKDELLEVGYDVDYVNSGDDAFQYLTGNEVDLLLLDLKMPGKSGLELIPAARAINPEMQIVVLTGYGSIATATEAVRLGALYYLPKPADVDDILGAFARNPKLALEIDQDEFSAPSLARAEWEHINRVLTDCDGNISLAAKKLDLHRRTLQRKLQKYPPNK